MIFFYWFPAVCAGYIDFAGCPDDGAAVGGDIFDVSVGGFLASTFGASDCLQAAGVDTGISQGGYDPCFGGGFEFHIVVIAVEELLFIITNIYYNNGLRMREKNIDIAKYKWHIDHMEQLWNNHEKEISI